jgi:hypothetical protein
MSSAGDLPKRIKGVDVAARFTPARELGAILRLPAPEPNGSSPSATCRGVPAALYSAFAGELVRSRTFRCAQPSRPARPPMASMNTILHEQQLEDATARCAMPCSTSSGGPSSWPTRACPSRSCQGETVAAAAGVPGSFAVVVRVSFDLAVGDVFVFCTMVQPGQGGRNSARRLLGVVAANRKSARAHVDAIFIALHDFSANAPRTTT